MERFSIEERAWITFAIVLGAVFLAQLLGAIIGIYSAKRKIRKEQEQEESI
jgi:ABC-type dipeptide/oligopeptide/nickel transport system permease component